MAKNRLSDTKIAEMLAVWLETRSVSKTALKCRVSHTTVKRYKAMQKWDEVAEKTTQAVVKRVEKESVKRSIRQAKLGIMLQDASVNTMRMLGEARAEEGKEAIPIVMPPQIAAAAKIGVEIENEALGANKDKDVTITLKLPSSMVKELIGDKE